MTKEQFDSMMIFIENKKTNKVQLILNSVTCGGMYSNYTTQLQTDVSKIERNDDFIVCYAEYYNGEKGNPLSVSSNLRDYYPILLPYEEIKAIIVGERKV